MGTKMKRSIKSNQREVRMIAFRIEGSTGTPTIEGMDKEAVSVVDTAAGTYTITFANAFAKAPQVVATCEAVDKCPSVGTITSTGCVIKVSDIDETAALSDDDVQVIIIGTDVDSYYN
jgi:hypothetical protein